MNVFFYVYNSGFRRKFKEQCCHVTQALAGDVFYVHLSMSVQHLSVKHKPSICDLNLYEHEENHLKMRADSKNDNSSNTQQCNYRHIESFDEAL